MLKPKIKSPLRRRRGPSAAIKKKVASFTSETIRKAKRAARDATIDLDAGLRAVRSALPVGTARAQREKELRVAAATARRTLKAALMKAAKALDSLEKKL